MDSLMAPIDRAKLLAELTPERLLRTTSKGNNQIFRFTHREAPSLMYEVGRLRELSFRNIGCGSGKAIDIDEYDVGEKAYNQLIVWNPRDKEIVGGYRYAVGENYLDDPTELSMSHYFKMSKRYSTFCLPYSIELGRAWVNPQYQPNAQSRKSIFALDNLWDGIGAVLVEYPQVKYLTGKITISANYHPVGRALILWLLNHYFRDKLHLLSPIKPIGIPDVRSIAGIEIDRNNFESDYRRISAFLRREGLIVPPLISAYLGLAKKITTFGVTYNKELGYAFETGMLLNVANIYADKYERYVKPNASRPVVNHHSSCQPVGINS